MSYIRATRQPTRVISSVPGPGAFEGTIPRPSEFRAPPVALRRPAAPGADDRRPVHVRRGGAPILGGEGAIWRTAVGVLFVAMIGNGFTLLAWNPLAVGGDAWSRLRTS